MNPELIADYECKTGEGPLWHPQEKKLYWLDIPNGRMFRYDPSTGHHERVYEGPMVGGITVQEDGNLLLFMDKGAIKVWKDGEFLDTIVESLPGEEESRFNDVIADPAGRVFCGTMPSPKGNGRLYLLDRDGSIKELLSGIGCSNGMGYTLDRKQMYYTDSAVRKIYLFDYDQETSAITNQRVFVETAEGDGIPDGMTVDREGYIWSARWDGACAVRFDPGGNEVQRIQFPAKKVSCITFAGDEYADMYVTTAGGDNKPEEGEGAGALFRLDAGVRGLPEFCSRICL